MDTFLEGKKAIVTGGSRGIGRAITEALLNAGASVAICARNASDVDRAVNEMTSKWPERIFGMATDVGRSEDVSRFFAFIDDQLKGLDVLVNNAGVGKFQKTADMSIGDWQQVVDTNLTGVFYCCREGLSRFRNKTGAYIVNISSLAGKNPFSGGAAYNASKFGLNGFSEAMMLDHRYDGVRVSYIMPGSVDTDFDTGGGAGASWKIAPSDIAEIVLMLLRMPQRTMVSRIEVRPSRPAK